MTLSNDVLAQDLLTLSQLYNLQAVLQTMNDNLILIEEGANGKIITGNNLSLFALAAQYYGDAQQWTTIAQANGLVDPYMTGGTIIQINIRNNGQNYVSPVATISGGETIDASVLINVINGSITSIDVLSGGLYSTLPTITITDSDGFGTGATANAICLAQLVIPQTSINTGGALTSSIS